MNNPPAFPVQSIYIEDQETNSRGMTLRDYFAAKAMQAFCSDCDWRLDMMPSETARAAYHQADAMMKEREK